jgi:hypothetical protein
MWSRGVNRTRGRRAGNPYLPETATELKIIEETPNIKSFRVRFDDDTVAVGVCL